ncbi:MAG: M20/M25/M40 family metallo-hydrolase [Acidimicrobiia bacterium]|nr:M20/M25/M40 family metallo-hydrolase [Acidimicrobiia bacterium]
MAKTTLLTLLLLGSAPAQEISSNRIRAHVEFLSSDLLEGRGTGERGGELATAYLASQLAIAGAKPGSGDGWFQPVTLTGVATQPGSKLAAGSLTFQFPQDFVGQTRARKPEVSLNAEMIFVGHGISAPEFQWDDYRGAEVKGKTVVLFTNEPQSKDPALFGGPALTYYGRWSYKFEEAARRGAAAALIIHTNSTAGYGWDVVRNSWGREEAQASESGLVFAGWLHQEAGARLLAQAGHKLDDLLKRAGARGFRAIPLKQTLEAAIQSNFRQIPVRNVAGRIPGSDPVLASEAIVFAAHWDHLGIDRAANGDGIYNGAVDNATGCAMLLEIAQAWAALEPKPRRTALFLFTAAEEAGLLGAEYYAANPIVPLAKTALVLNFDSFYPFGRASDVVVNGAERITFWPQVQSIAQRFRLTISPDPRPEQGSFFRSDHFPFAKAGVAAFSVSQGNTYLTDRDAKRERQREYSAWHYHRPSDEYRADWDFSGMEEMARFGMALGQAAASGPKKAEWVTATARGRK